MSALTQAVLWRVKFSTWAEEPTIVAPEGASLATFRQRLRLNRVNAPALPAEHV